MTKFEEALETAYRWQNRFNILSILIAVIGVALIYFEYIKDTGAYVLAAVLVMMLLWTKLYAAKIGLARVWKCPHCKSPLPMEKGTKRGDPKWMPVDVGDHCPVCKHKLN
ncbi:MAG: hypothetical protein HUJ85_01665 [Veillonella sp.]|nr:hypothetical protein [Veillonella sp.]